MANFFSNIFGGSKPPPPTDPAKLTQMSNDQKIAEEKRKEGYELGGRTNVYGNQSQWTQGPDGRWNQTSTLGGFGQDAAGGFAQLGQDYFDKVGAAINNRPDMGSMEGFNRADQLWQQTEEPRMQRQREAEYNRLVNMGHDPRNVDGGFGSAMGDLSQQQADARARFTLGAQGQMFGQGLADRNQQMGEYNMLSPGLQFGMNAINSGQTGAPGINVGSVDTAGIYQNADAMRMKQWQQEEASRNAMWGGLAGLGGAALGGPFGGYLGQQMFGGKKLPGGSSTSDPGGF